MSSNSSHTINKTTKAVKTHTATANATASDVNKPTSDASLNKTADRVEEKKDKGKKKVKKQTLPRESKAEKLTLILKRHNDEEKKNPITYKSLESLATRRNRQPETRSSLLLSDFSLKDIEIIKYSAKKEKELLESRSRHHVTGSLPSLVPNQVDYVKNLELGIPVRLKDWIPVLENDAKRKLQKLEQPKVNIPKHKQKSNILSVATGSNTIDLLKLIGNDQEIIRERIASWGSFYESRKDDNEWNSDENLIVFEIEALSPISGGGDDEISSRILDIFQDGPIADLVYADDSKIEIKYGTSKALLDALIFPLSDQDSTYTLEFLYGYRFFMGSIELLDGLMSWYNVDVQDGQKSQIDFLKTNRRTIQKKVMNVLNTWIKNYWNDFLADRQLYQNLHFFLHCLSQVSYVDYQKLSQGIREQWLNWYTYVYVPPFTNTSLVVSSVETNYNILEMDSSVWATYLTAIDKTYFSQIKENCYIPLLHCACTCRGGAYNTRLLLILESFSWFRSVAHYICTIIDSQENTKKRTKAIQKCIKVAKYLYDYGDFQGVFAVMHGLLMPRSLSLASAWEGVKQKHINSFKMLYCFVDSRDGYLCYWTKLSSSFPCIPFFALHFNEIIRSDANLSTFLNPKEEMKTFGTTGTERIVNFTKFKEIYAILSEIEKYRTCKIDAKFHINREILHELVQHVKLTADYSMATSSPVNDGKSKLFSGLRKSI